MAHGYSTRSWFWLATITLLASAACHSPNAPSVITAPPLDTVSLTILVTDTSSGQPLANVPVLLPDAKPTAEHTDAMGQATWTVLTNRAYAVSVCDVSVPAGVILEGTAPVGWLVSIPAVRCHDSE